jgi:phosphoglycerate dehydrogenase-like enzyme
MMKVLLTKPFFQADLDYIHSKLFKGIELIIPPNYKPETLEEFAQNVDVFFGGTITETLLQKAKKLKFIQVPWTGVDNLNFDLLSKYNITIANSHSNSLIVAEHSIALMFDAAKKISFHDRNLRLGNWNRINNEIPNEISPFSKGIYGSNIGIVGFGAIGKNIHKLLAGFECNFKIFSKNKKTDNLANTSFYSIDEFLQELYQIDFVFICIPLTNETKNLVNESFLGAMNKDSILINISRGEVINENDLYFSLYNKKIGFAGIDTWYNYPSKENTSPYPSIKNNFHLLNNVILSPHRAGYAESGLFHLDDAIENLNRYLEGKPLINIISLIDKY